MKWNNIKDGMPPLDVDVLVSYVANGVRGYFAGTRSRHINNYTKQEHENWVRDEFGNTCCSHEIDNMYDEDVTHWALIPEAKDIVPFCDAIQKNFAMKLNSGVVPSERRNTDKTEQVCTETVPDSDHGSSGD